MRVDKWADACWVAIASVSGLVWRGKRNNDVFLLTSFSDSVNLCFLFVWEQIVL